MPQPRAPCCWHAAYATLPPTAPPISVLHTLPPLHQVMPLPDDWLVHHAALYDEYHNATHWPKHVLVHYEFERESDIDFDLGLYVLLIFGEWCPVCAAQYLVGGAAGVSFPAGAAHGLACCCRRLPLNLCLCSCLLHPQASPRRRCWCSPPWWASSPRWRSSSEMWWATHSPLSPSCQQQWSLLAVPCPMCP